MRFVIFVALTLLVAFLVCSCGDDDEEETPTTGTVSGTVTFVGTPPEDTGEIQVSIWSVLGASGYPEGPPDHYSAAFEEFTGDVKYTISGVSFGTYKLAAVGYEPSDAPMGTPETILGMYGFAPPGDMQADSFTVSEEEPEATGIDIIADYSAIGTDQSQHQ